MSRGTPCLAGRPCKNTDDMSVVDQREVMMEVGSVENVVTIILRRYVNGNNEQADVISIIEGVHKIADSSAPPETGVEV